MENLKGLRDVLLELESGKSPGTGGLRAEFLIVLAERMDGEQIELLESFGLRYMGGDLLPWFYKVWLTLMTVPLFKNALKEAVRPVGVRNLLARTFHKEGVTQNKEEFVEFLEPEQLAMSVAGGGKLVFSVRMLVEDKREYVAVKIDMENAFNAVSRASIIEELEEEPSLQHLAGLAAVVLAPAHGLEAGGKKWGESAEGATQGDPLSSPFFNVAWHREVRKLDATLKERGGMARFGMDDGYAVGPPEVVFPALEIFARDVKQKCLLNWNHSKTEVFSWSGVLPPSTTAGLRRAGEEVDGVFEPGFVCYGVPTGSDNYVLHMMNKKVEEVA